MLSFGAKTSTTTPTAGTIFGSTAQSTAAPQFGFGSNLQQPASTGFGTSLTTSTVGTGFTAPQLSGLAFGTTNPASTTSGFSFGVPAPAATAPTGLFGSTTSSGPTLGTATTIGAPSLFGSTNAPNFGLGSTASTPATATSAPTTGFTLGGTSTGTGGFSLGSTSTAPASFSFGSAAPVTASTAAPAFSLTAAAVTSAVPVCFASSATTSSAPGLSFSLAASTTGPATFSFGQSSTTTPASSGAQTATTSAGLGGLASAITKPKTDATGTVITQKETNPKEQALPNEIFQTVESFKQHIKQQKMYSSDIAHCSLKDFDRVRRDIDSFNKVVIGLERELQMNRCLAEKLKYDTAKSLQHIEMAQRTQETPPGLQYENSAPMQYFNELVDNFEKEMHALKLQIESTDKYIKHFGQPASLTSQDLTVGMKRLHETFVALAGRLQSVHSQVETQKELYLNIRKQVFNDNTNPFENQEISVPVVQKQSMYVPPKVASGPIPFNNMVVSTVTLTNLQNNPPPAYPYMGGASIGGFGASPFSLGTGQTTTHLGGAGLMNPSNSFQLQKPPTGNKRGKQC